MLYAITNVTVIDMSGSDPRPESTVIVTDNRITAVGPSDTTDVPERAKVVDGILVHDHRIRRKPLQHRLAGHLLAGRGNVPELLSEERADVVTRHRVCVDLGLEFEHLTSSGIVQDLLVAHRRVPLG